jgi:hypothetical protein
LDWVTDFGLGYRLQEIEQGGLDVPEAANDSEDLTDDR